MTEEFLFLGERGEGGPPLVLAPVCWNVGIPPAAPCDRNNLFWVYSQFAGCGTVLLLCVRVGSTAEQNSQSCCKPSKGQARLGNDAQQRWRADLYCIVFQNWLQWDFISSSPLAHFSSWKKSLNSLKVPEPMRAEKTWVPTGTWSFSALMSTRVKALQSITFHKPLFTHSHSVCQYEAVPGSREEHRCLFTPAWSRMSIKRKREDLCRAEQSDALLLCITTDTV